MLTEDLLTDHLYVMFSYDNDTSFIILDNRFLV